MCYLCRTTRIALALIALLAFCSPPPAKTYDQPEIGMSNYPDFQKLCGIYPGETHSITTARDTVETINNGWYDVEQKERPAMCVGKFTFTNGKLTSIEH